MSTTFKQPSIARGLLSAFGLTARSFADYHKCSEQWVYAVLNGRAPAPARFRKDFCAFLTQHGVRAGDGREISEETVFSA